MMRSCLGILMLVLTACTKGKDDFLFKSEILTVRMKGYNGSSEYFDVKLDTIQNGRQVAGESKFDNTLSYALKEGQDMVKLVITEETTGKVVLEREVRREENPLTINFLYMDGVVSDMPEPPPAEDGKIKLIYMFQPNETNYAEPVDIVIGKYFVTPQVFEEITRLRNVRPNEFSDVATIATFSTARQEYNGVMTSVSFLVRIYKAGTNVPYIDGTSYTWNALSSTAPKPAASTASSKLYIFSEIPAGNIMRFFTRLEL